MVQTPVDGDPTGNGIIDLRIHRVAPAQQESRPPVDFRRATEQTIQDVLANQPKPPTPPAKPKDEVVVEGDDGC